MADRVPKTLSDVPFSASSGDMVPNTSPGIKFSASSGEMYESTRLPYYQLVQQKRILQNKDAEVNILQKIDDHLLEHILGATWMTLYMRGSKGPCTSCRGLIAIFRRRFPYVKVICDYQQKSAVVQDTVGKEKGQDALTYGYEDATMISKGSNSTYRKVFPAAALNIQNPAEMKVSGIRKENLDNQFNLYQKEKKENKDLTALEFARGRPRTVVESDKQAVELAAWLENREKYGQQTTLSETELVA